jgi:phosphoribosylanthranilate isomerase
MTRTRIKICGITRVEDALAARAPARRDRAHLLARDAAPRRLRASARDRAALPPFVSTVGLFVDPSADEVRAALDAVRCRRCSSTGTRTPRSAARSAGPTSRRSRWPARAIC